MNKQVYLISEKYIKTHTPIDDNVPSNILFPAIEYAQNIELVQLIGSNLLDTLKELVKNNALIDGDKYKILLDDYIVPYLAQIVIKEIQIPISYKIKNKGVINTSDEKVTNTPLEEIKFIKEYYASRGRFLGQRIIEYLQDNNMGDMNTSDSAWRCPIVM